MTQIINELHRLRCTQTVRYIISQLVPRATDRCFGRFDEITTSALTLWTILRWERKLGRVIIESLVSDIENLQRAVDKLMTEQQMASESSCQSEHIDRCIRSLVAKARLEADMLGHSWVGSEHLVLSVIVTADHDLRRVLHESGMSYERVKIAIEENLESHRNDER